MAASQEFDYIIAGGGLCGCVVAARLKEAFPNYSIALVEIGEDTRNDPAILSPAAAWTLKDEYYYTYNTVPQQHLHGQCVPLKTGKTLGGGSAVNYGGWTRGDRAGYDEWASVVGDQSWSYDGLLPYFKRTETWSIKDLHEQHGYNGPIRPSLSDRNYPLKEAVREAMLSTGVAGNEDGNRGDIMGVVQLAESWHENSRTYAAGAYDLSGVEVLTGCQITKVLMHGKRATGVSLHQGEVLRARKEVIISCGALRTPQLLMLSGIGAQAELAKLGITQEVEAPGVGQNLHDHVLLSFWYKLRNPDDGLALGAPSFMANPKYFEGNVMEWFLNASAPVADKEKAAEIDGVLSKRPDDFEIPFAYAALPTSPFPVPPMDGKVVTIAVALLSTTSRGRISLTSSNINDPPLVDPAYMSTAHDLAVTRAGIRLALQIMDSPAAQTFATTEIPPGSLPTLTPTSTDAELDERIKKTMVTCYHYSGTAAMGDVVDTKCRVKGVEALRVVDASILPVSISGHIQAALYGTAEQAAQMIIDHEQSIVR